MHKEAILHTQDIHTQSIEPPSLHDHNNWDFLYNQAPQNILRKETYKIENDTRFDAKKWYLLPGTGFNVSLQTEMLENLLNGDLSQALEREDIVDAWLTQTEQDIQGFKIEYLLENPLFPIVIEKKEINGEERITSPLYKDKPWLDTVSGAERSGAVKSSIEKIEKFLLDAQPNSVAVLTSPPGWSGLRDSDGREIHYPDTQTYILQTQKDSSIRGFTLRSDMDLSQNIQLLKSFGKDIDPNKRSQQDIITDIVDTPIFLSSQKDSSWCTEDIIERVRGIKATDTLFADRTFADVYDQLENPENLWTLDSKTQELTDTLRDFVTSEIKKPISATKLKTRIQIALGTTVLKLAEKIRKPKTVSEIHYGYDQNNVHTSSSRNYQEILREVQEIPGCNGGGQAVFSTPGGSVTVESGGMYRKASIFEQQWAPGVCKLCNLKALVGGCSICRSCEKTL